MIRCDFHLVTIMNAISNCKDISYSSFPVIFVFEETTVEIINNYNGHHMTPTQGCIMWHYSSKSDDHCSPSNEIEI